MQSLGLLCSGMGSLDPLPKLTFRPGSFQFSVVSFQFGHVTEVGYVAPTCSVWGPHAFSGQELAMRRSGEEPGEIEVCDEEALE